MAWLLDTNVPSELKRPEPSQRVTSFLDGCLLDELYISTVTLAEIRFGIQSALDPGRCIELADWLADRVRPMFSERTLEITEDIMLRWRLLVEEGRKTGRTFSQPDLIIAATALQHELILVTRNVKDFKGLAVPVLNPWDAP